MNGKRDYTFITLYEVDEMAKVCDLSRPEVLVNLFAQGWGEQMSFVAFYTAQAIYTEGQHGQTEEA